MKNFAYPVDTILDTSGLWCPEPVMLLHQKIRTMRVGEIVEIIASDASTQRDIPKFCQFLGHELLDKETQHGKFIFYIKKG